MLSISFNQMISNFIVVVRQVDLIAQGDISANIAPKSEEDTLGLALQEMTQKLREVADATKSISKGNIDNTIDLKGKNDVLAMAINTMTSSLQKNRSLNNENIKLKEGIAKIANCISNQDNYESLGKDVLQELIKITKSESALFYMVKKGITLSPVATYAYFKPIAEINDIEIGEGKLGHIAKSIEDNYIENINNNYKALQSNFLSIKPNAVAFIPLAADGIPIGLLEIASLDSFTETDKLLITAIKEQLGIAIQGVTRQVTSKELLEETQRQSEELERQTEELLAQQARLRSSNEELEEQSTELIASGAELEVQAKELQQNNEYLELKSNELKSQNLDIKKQKRELEDSR